MQIGLYVAAVVAFIGALLPMKYPKLAILSAPLAAVSMLCVAVAYYGH